MYNNPYGQQHCIFHICPSILFPIKLQLVIIVMILMLISKQAFQCSFLPSCLPAARPFQEIVEFPSRLHVSVRLLLLVTALVPLMALPNITVCVAHVTGA